jgi:hypothetical protein
MTYGRTTSESSNIFIAQAGVSCTRDIKQDAETRRFEDSFTSKTFIHLTFLPAVILILLALA